MSLRDVITEREHQNIAFGHVEFEYGSEIFYKLYDYYLPVMPYGIAKAREGDPADWIFERLLEEW